MRSRFKHHIIDTDLPDGNYAQTALVDLDHDGRQFIIRTNADGAEDYKLVTAPVDAPARDNWTDLVPHESGRLVLGLHVTNRHL